MGKILQHYRNGKNVNVKERDRYEVEKINNSQHQDREHERRFYRKNIPFNLGVFSKNTKVL